ncbi:[Pyruvate dehydrogenase (acetyl-transferring)] kinase isozyme 2, mitochondrial [Stylophora pistillata]|uniref:Protein-serine/threonine kinase n=1 Tax=Stylophora pistillata TaxID=50429 RepID=A0A2B4RL66_STYPI|nr:[Pyruvate dehydrogenase (acetyl-transferring)] kinase isozyme 2, mitochondrial [Stylophora pistillata]
MRLAHTIREFDLLPENLLKIPSVELVRGWYVQSFSEVTELQDEQETDEVLKRYTQCLMDIKQHHKDVVETMAQGIMELRQKEGDDAFHPSIQYFLAVDLEDPIQMADVPGHLYHILSELLKISDQGGGIPRSTIDKVFEYHYTSAPEPLKADSAAPIAGYGYGLPLSRLYARYFDGELQLYSMEGFGTDAVIWLKGRRDYSPIRTVNATYHTLHSPCPLMVSSTEEMAE